MMFSCLMKMIGLRICFLELPKQHLYAFNSEIFEKERVIWSLGILYNRIYLL